MRRENMPAILTLASVLDFGQLLPKPRITNCPKCNRGKLSGPEGGLRYCQRCAYTEKASKRHA